MFTRILGAAALIVITSHMASAAEPLKVVASFSILGDLAKQVGGDAVAVTTLVGPNGDAHVYEPRPADAAALSRADVVLVNGLGLEGFMPRLIEASGTKAPIVEAIKGVSLLKMDEAAHDHAHEGAAHHHHHGEHDPHAWQSVTNAEIYVRNIADAFCSADPAGCDGFKTRAARYNETLQALDAEIRQELDVIPAAKRTVITSHEAFAYFAEAYNMTFLAPEGVSTEAEASAADVAALIRQVREDTASAIFMESITNPRLIEQIASETGLKVGGELYSDALSDETGPAATYEAMMRHNAETIRAAIAGR